MGVFWRLKNRGCCCCGWSLEWSLGGRWVAGLFGLVLVLGFDQGVRPYFSILVALGGHF
jgi:hypothetical protein